MSEISKVDPSTLGWVKAEIDETLKQARLALESFVENPADSTRLRFCATYLHQVVGTLQMVELDGAAMLAKEAEAVVESVLNQQVTPDEPLYEALTRAILSLPDYLARLQFGQPDAPLRLLPLVNELRAARKTEPLSELELFHPDLSVRPPRNDKRRSSEEDFIALAKKSRSTWQSSMLAWLKDPQNKEPLAKMADILNELQDTASVGVMEQLFWIASGLVEAFQAGDLEATNERKKLLSRFDQLLKRVIDGKDKASFRNAAESLIKAMLYEIGQGGSASEKGMQLRRAFSLDLLLKGAPDLSEIQDLPSPEALKSVAAVMAGEIESAQELLAAYFDPGRDDVKTLDPVIEKLEKMSGALAVLGATPVKNLVEELMQTCRAVMAGEVKDKAPASMRMARALLLIEHSSRDLHQLGTNWSKQIDDQIAGLKGLCSTHEAGIDGIEISDAPLTDSEFKQLLVAVAGEIRVNLAKVEEALEKFASNTEDAALIEPAPHFLNQVQGALQILGQERAAYLADITNQRIRDVHAGALAPNQRTFDALAVAVGTLEVYLEGLEHDRPNLTGLIDLALRDLDEAFQGQASQNALSRLPLMEACLDRWLDTQAADAREEFERYLGELTETAQNQGYEKIARLAAEMATLLAALSEAPGDQSNDVGDTLRQSWSALADVVRQQLQQAKSRPAASPKPVEPDVQAVSETTQSDSEIEDLDEEILQIFIEDARDVLQSVQQNHLVWRENVENKGALVELRRGFHTLKGSGRMVGASEIAELAWSVENLLNHIREEKVSASDAVFVLLQEVEAALPLLITQLESGAPSGVNTAALRERADQLAKGSESQASQDAGESGADGAPGTAQRSSGALDPTLLQIFTNEATGHIANLRAVVQSGPGGLVSPSIIRAVHTLQGNARYLDLPFLAETCAQIEHFLQQLELQQQPLEREHLSLIDGLASAVSALLETLNQGQSPGIELAERFHALASTCRVQGARFAEERASRERAAPPAEEIVMQTQAPEVEEAPIFDDAPVSATPAADFTAEGAVEQVDPELLEIFLEEASDILESIEEALARLRTNGTDRPAMHSLKRGLHTLKGGARMAGAMTMGDLSHHTESLLGRLESGEITLTSELLDLLDEVHDVIVPMLAHLRDGRPMPKGVTGVDAKLQAWLSGAPASQAEEIVPPEAPAIEAPTAPSPTPVADAPSVRAEPSSHADVPMPEPSRPAAPAETPAVAPKRAVEEDVRTPAIAARAAPDNDGDEAIEVQETGIGDRREQIKVRTSVLNDLVNFAGEVSISRSRMEQQIFGLREHLSELNRNVTRFRHQIRELEIQAESQILYRAEQTGGTSDFDPLEFDRFSKLQHLSRGLAESLHDLSTLHTTLDNFASEAETVLLQQARINTDLQEGLMRTRMISFSTQAGRLRHIVRQTARELGKRAELTIEGADVELDRTVLERMIGPFEHMIRNALDHGLESDAERKKRRKPAAGHIKIAVSQEGNEIVIRFGDDGAGLNVAAIQKRAIERGLLNADANLSDEEIIQFILLPGFSTAQKITQLSGRGVGMDVVHSEVKQLGGSITVDTRKGEGTTFVIRLPLTLSITQALTIYVGDQAFAIPLSSISNILEVPAQKLNSLSMGEKPLFQYQEQVYPFMQLAARLGLPAQPRNAKKVPVLLAKSGNREIAIQVDGVGSTTEIVVKPLGPQLSAIKGLAGATILGDGRVVLILDVAGLWVTEEMHVVRSVPSGAERSVEERQNPVIMVVDDSLTVRKVTSRHLQKRGMEVMVAKDGLDAWEQLRERVPDLMLVDIEMPRMDGYELSTNVRSDPSLKHIPIIMITSRAGTKHRERAMQIGVNMYMSKPYQEEELFRNIQQLLEAVTV